MIAAARTLFVEQGWQATTLAAVARGAGVSAETIYAVFGGKTALLKAVIEAAVRRDDPATPLLEQAGPKAVVAATDQRALIAMFCEDISTVLDNVAELMAVTQMAARSDPELARTYASLHEGRRHNFEKVVAALGRLGPLRNGMSQSDAAAEIWRLASPDLFLLVTQVEGRSIADYAEWLDATLARLLLVE